MKHVSASVLERAAAAELVTEDDLKAKLRARFEGGGFDKTGLARSLGLTVFQVTLLLRGRANVTERVAKALGYRKVIRYERVE